jgi:endonuclease/exonuclease/phosphatase family metal-dependent hydrolase
MQPATSRITPTYRSSLGRDRSIRTSTTGPLGSSNRGGGVSAPDAPRPTAERNIARRKGPALIPVQLRIGTCNLLHGIDVRTGRLDLSAAAEAIAALDLDVVAVQEVDRDLPRSGGEDQVRVLADRLGMRGAFAPALLGDPDDRWTAVGTRDPGGPAYGVGLLTRLPILRTRRTVLPGGGDGRRGTGRVQPSADGRPAGDDGPPSLNPGWDREPRTALTAELDAGAGGTLRVTSLHLSYLPWRALGQLRVAARAARGDGPSVLAGDCNLPVWPVRRVLGTAWDHAGGTPTYPAWDPRLQVDQIAVSGGVVVEDVEVVAPGPSDHRSVLVTVTLPAAG